MNITPNDRVSIWFQLLLNSRNITEPSKIGFPKAFRISDIIPIYKDELVSVEHILLLLAKANYLVISKYNLDRINQLMLEPKLVMMLQPTFISMMFTIDLDNTKKFLERGRGMGPQLELEF